MTFDMWWTEVMGEEIPAYDEVDKIGNEILKLEVHLAFLRNEHTSELRKCHRYLAARTAWDTASNMDILDRNRKGLENDAKM